MKKTGSLLIILFSILISELVFSAQFSAISSKEIKGGKYYSLNFYGQAIATNNYVQAEINQSLMQNQRLVFNCSESSSSNVTTANIDWIAYKGSTAYIIKSDTLTSGIATANFYSNDLRLTIYNYNTITSNITGNIIIY